MSARWKTSEEKPGVRVLTGSWLMEMAATTISRARRAVSLPTRRRLSPQPSPGPALRGAWRGRTASRPTISPRYDRALSPKATAIPQWATTAAPRTGPMARERLNVSDDMARADGTGPGGTRSGTMAWMAGTAKAHVNPITSTRPMTTGVVTSPAPCSAASSGGHRGGDDLGHDDEPPPVEAVGGRPRPRRQEEHADELGEVHDADEERRLGQAVDEDRLGDVLEPGAAVGEQVAGEVGPEVADL